MDRAGIAVESGPVRGVPSRSKPIVQLINTTDYVPMVFAQANALEASLRPEIEAYLGSEVGPKANLYELTFVRCLKAYLDSKLRFESIEQTAEFAKAVEVADGVPWFVGLLQSLWHLKNDCRWVRENVDKQQAVGILVSIYNETKFAELCLRSVRRLAGFPHFVVAANNSTIDVSSFRNAMIEEGLVDEWFETGCERHGDGLQRALGRVRRFRYIATVDSDAVGLKQGWLRELVERMGREGAGLIGPPRRPDSRQIIDFAIHPCCMVIDQQQIGSKFQIDFRNQWPYWDAGGLLTWDCMLHRIPIVRLSNEYSGPCALFSSLVNKSVRHYWYASRISTLDDDAELDGYKVADIRQRLEREYQSAELEGIKNFRKRQSGEASSVNSVRLAGAENQSQMQNDDGDGDVSNTLDQIAIKHGTDKSSLCHNYTKYYFKYFSCLRDRPLRILEIGVGHGRSLRMWEEFFPNAELFGIDTNARCLNFANKRVKIFIGDQSDADFLRSFAERVGGGLDVIIDDGGHYMHQQMTSLRVLFRYLKPAGIYVIEDLHTSYWAKFGGGRDRPDTTVELLKSLVDEVNSRGEGKHGHLAEVGSSLEALECEHFARHVDSVHFCSGICFIFKKNFERRMEVVHTESLESKEGQTSHMPAEADLFTDDL